MILVKKNVVCNRFAVFQAEISLMGTNRFAEDPEAISKTANLSGDCPTISQRQRVFPLRSGPLEY